MIIDNLHTIGVSVPPLETDAPLVVDADAPLPFPVAGELFKAIRGRNAKEIKGSRTVNLRELSQGDALDVGRKLLREESVEYLFRFLALERPDHGYIVTYGVSIVKGYYSGGISSVSHISAVKPLPAGSVVRQTKKGGGGKSWCSLSSPRWI